MDGLSARAARLAGAASWSVRRAARGWSRRHGLWGWAMLAAAACALGAGALLRGEQLRAGALAQQLAAQRSAQSAAAALAPLAPAAAPAASASGMAGARARLRAFDQHLLPHEDLPVAVQALLDLGSAEGLSVLRGSYRLQADSAGGFVRYRMSLPVQGAAPAVQRFMLAALRQQPNLALDSVQFKRARIGATEIEARIQWVLLARLPAAGAQP